MFLMLVLVLVLYEMGIATATATATTTQLPPRQNTAVNPPSKPDSGQPRRTLSPLLSVASSVNAGAHGSRHLWPSLAASPACSSATTSSAACRRSKANDVSSQTSRSAAVLPLMAVAPATRISQRRSAVTCFFWSFWLGIFLDCFCQRWRWF